MAQAPVEVKQLTREVGGWLTDREGSVLFDLAKSCRGDGVIVEIGSYKGKSTIWLGKGSQAGRNVKVYAIDPHTDAGGREPGKVPTFQDFQRNIAAAGLTDTVVPIVKTSADAVRDFDLPVELIFIDGAHDFDSVKQDFDLWFPKVIDGGIMAFHDTVEWIPWPKQDQRLYCGPKEVVRDYVFKSTRFRDATFVMPQSSLTYARKVRMNSLSDRSRSRAMLFMKDAYEMAAIFRHEVKRARRAS